MTESLLLEYNSKREHLKIPEYGRHVHKLIKHAKTIEDPEYKQAFVERIIDLMHQMNPQNKNVMEYREKLWKHLFRIADYDLGDVKPPNGEVPQPENISEMKSALTYPKTSFKYRHYGYNIQQMIEKASAMEDGEIKDGYIQIIGYYMKLAYKNWNRDHYVNDEIIKEDLVAISGGKIQIPESFSLDHINYPSSNSYSGNKKRHHGKRGNKKYSKNNNRNRRK